VPLPAAHFLGPGEISVPASVHFAAVGHTAIFATAAAIILTAIGVARQDGRAVLVGTAFTAMAALLALHGLATPGIILGFNGVVSFSGGATLPVGGAVLALSAFPVLRGPEGVRPLLWLQGLLLAAIGILGVLGWVFPGLVPAVPEPASLPAVILLLVGLALYGLVGLRALHTFLLTRRGADLCVVVGLAWLAGALVAALMLDFRQLGWWVGHGLELGGIAAVGGAVALDLHRSVQSRPLAGDLRGSELVSEEQAFLGSHIRALTVSLAEKDEYTEEHTRRVALGRNSLNRHPPDVEGLKARQRRDAPVVILGTFPITFRSDGAGSGADNDAGRSTLVQDGGLLRAVRPRVPGRQRRRPG